MGLGSSQSSSLLKYFTWVHDNLLRLVRAWMSAVGPHAPVQGKGAICERLCHPKVDPTLLVLHHAPACRTPYLCVLVWEP